MIEKVKQYLAEQGYADRLLEFAEPGASATVELADRKSTRLNSSH